MQWLLLPLAAAYALAMLWGAGCACARLLQLLPSRLRPPERYRFLIGFGLFPVIVTWMGFAQLWRIPWSVPLVGAGLAAYGLYALVQRFRGRVVRKDTLLYWSVAIVVVCCIAWAKSVYFLGVTSHGDEMRSILLTNAFASNALKPAYPFDFSLPIAYPYYLFQTSAFLYSALGGAVLPTIPLLAISLFAIGLSFRTLYVCCEAVFPSHTREKFLLASSFLSFSSLRGFFDAGRQVFRSPPQDIFQYFHAGYHYLWGTMLGVLGIILLWRALCTGKKHVALGSILFFCLSFTYTGITSVWLAAGAMLLLPIALVRHRASCFRLLSPGTIALALCIVLAVVTPQFANFLPRLAPTFVLSSPHLWFARDLQLFLLEYGFSLWFAKALAFDLANIIVVIGFFLTIGFFRAPAVFVRSLRSVPKRIADHELTPFAAVLVASMLLLTFTDAPSGDWYGRGFLAVTVVSCFLAADFFFPAFRHTARMPMRAAAILLLGLHLLSFGLQQTWNISVDDAYEKTITAASKINDTYSLGTILYRDSYDDVAETILRAGRAVATVPPAAFLAYLNAPEDLLSIGLPVTFFPCERTWYGKATPQGSFVDFRQETDMRVLCD